MIEKLSQEQVRTELIRQEDTIIYALVERAQFRVNEKIYEPGSSLMPNSDKSFVDYMLHGTEVLHATLHRYSSPDEHPFFVNLPEPVVPPRDFKMRIKPNTININARIKRVYETNIIPTVCESGDDQQYGSSAVCDVTCLQAISKFVHYGKFVGECKFQASEADLTPFVKSHNEAALRKGMFDSNLDATLLERIEKKTATYAQQVEEPGAYKIPPASVVKIFREYLLPLSQDVELAYLARRLD